MFDVSVNVYSLYVFTFYDLFGCYIYYIFILSEGRLVILFYFYPIVVAVWDVLLIFCQCLLLYFLVSFELYCVVNVLFDDN